MWVLYCSLCYKTDHHESLIHDPQRIILRDGWCHFSSSTTREDVWIKLKCPNYCIGWHWILLPHSCSPQAELLYWTVMTEFSVCFSLFITFSSRSSLYKHLYMCVLRLKDTFLYFSMYAVRMLEYRTSNVTVKHHIQWSSIMSCAAVCWNTCSVWL